MEEVKTQQTYFNEFTRKIIDTEDYKGAYEILCKNMQARVNHNYDDHLFLQFSLLKQILKDENLDFSFLEDGSILLTSEEYEEGSMYESFVKFKYAVLKGDFREANEHIMDYELKEKRKRTSTKISTKLFVRLASAAARKSYEKEEKSLDKPIISKEEQALKYNENYRKFLAYLERKEYENALESIVEASKYVDEYSSNKINTIIQLLKDLGKVQKGEMVSVIGNATYDDLKDEYKRILYRAINKKDYKTAYKTVGKCIYFDKRNNAFKIYHTILSELVEEIKKLEAIEKKELEKETIITEEELLVLLENREYQRAKKLLENKLVNENNDRDSRMNHYVLKFLKVIEELKIGKGRFEESTPFIKDENNSIFKNFFDSVLSKDYITAYEYAILCRIEEGNNDSESLEFLAYTYLLEDISLYQKLKNYIHKEELTGETLEEIKNLYEQKIQLEGLEQPYDHYIFETIDTYQTIEEGKGSMPGFKQMDTKEVNLIKQFEDFMNQGDYFSAYRLMKEPAWRNETKNIPYKDQIILIKKILAIIATKIKTQPTSEKIDLSMLETPKVLEQLETLAALIEKEDYGKAEDYNLENQIDGSPDLLYDLSEFLPFLSIQQLREAQEIFYGYSKCYRDKDTEGAKKALETYRNFIKDTSLERNTEYYSKRIESLEKELASPDFEVKQSLMEEAKNLIQGEKQAEAIDVLTKYIELDQDMSTTGYSLRGNTYESLKLFSLAKKDYEKALTIVDEPASFYRLAKVNFYQGNYEKALECMLEFEARRPEDVQKSLQFIQEIYRHLGNEEKQEEYAKKSRKLAKTKKKKVVPPKMIK